MKLLIATATKPLSQDNYTAMCGQIRQSAKEGGLTIPKGIYMTPGPGCNNLAFELIGDDDEAERFANALTMALMPSKWSTFGEPAPEEDLCDVI